MLNYHLPFEHQDIQYKVIDESDRTEVETLLSNYFGPFEPMNHSAGITTSDFIQFAQLLTNYAILKKFSLVAKDKKTDKVVSVTILKDFTEDLPIDVAKVCPKLLPVFSLMGELAYQYISENPTISSGVVLELLVGITTPSYWNRGISTILWGTSEIVAKEHSFQKIVSCVTGIASQHITLGKLHYRECNSIAYKDFVYEGIPTFQDITESLACKFVEKNIPATPNS